MNKDGGRVARTAGLVITTATAAAAIQNTTWDGPTRFLLTGVVIIVGAFLASMATDFGGPEA